MWRKDVFTTGEAARFSGLGQSTIIRWFDRGTLEGFKIPGSGFRRILRYPLEKFMRENNIPIDLPQTEYEGNELPQERLPSDPLQDLTTGTIARILRINERTVARCVDDGSLKGHRKPGSHVRHIPLASLLECMQENGIPGKLLYGKDDGNRKEERDVTGRSPE